MNDNAVKMIKICLPGCNLEVDFFPHAAGISQ